MYRNRKEQAKTALFLTIKGLFLFYRRRGFTRPRFTRVGNITAVYAIDAGRMGTGKYAVRIIRIEDHSSDPRRRQRPLLRIDALPVHSTVGRLIDTAIV